MLFTSILALTALASSVVAAPSAPPYGSAPVASPKPSASKPAQYRIKVLSADPGNNAAFDQTVLNTYVVPSTGDESGDGVGRGSIDNDAWDRFTLIDDNTKVLFANKQSLTLDPLTTGFHSASTQFVSGADKNGLKAVAYRGTYLLEGTAKRFDSWIVCEDQYGAYLEWVDSKFSLKEANDGSQLCGFVVLQANIIGSKN